MTERVLYQLIAMGIIYSHAVWILSGTSIVLLLLLMVFLIVNCLCSFRRPAARADDREHLLDTQLEQIRETELAILQDHTSHAIVSHHDGSTIINQANHPHDQLTSDHLQEVFNKLYPARHKWQNIGIHLGMTNDLDAIKHDGCGQSDPCLMELLTKWFRRGKATRQALIAALKSASVDCADIATKLSADCTDHIAAIASTEVALSSRVGFKCPLCGNCSLQEYLDGKCPEIDMSSG